MEFARNLRSSSVRHRVKDAKIKAHAKARGRTQEVFAPSIHDDDDDDSVLDMEKCDPRKNPKMSKTEFQRSFIAESLVDGDNFVFEFMSEKKREIVIDHMECVSFQEGEMMIRQGDEGDYFYVIEKGDVAVYMPEEHQDLVVQSSREKCVFAVEEEEEEDDDELDTPESFRRLPLKRFENSTNFPGLKSDGAVRSHTIFWSGMIDSHSSLPVLPKPELHDDLNLDKDPIVVLGPGDTFGEIALVYNCPRMATCIAKTPCFAWRLHKLLFRRIIDSSMTPSSSQEKLSRMSHLEHSIADLSERDVHSYHRGDESEESIAGLLYSNQKVRKAGVRRRDTYETELAHAKQLLGDVRLLRDYLDDSHLQQLAHVMVPVRFRPSEHISIKGEDVDTFYIIKSGQVRIHDSGLGDSQSCEVTVGPGGFFGEQALLTNGMNNANITAVTETITLTLSREKFEETLGSLQDIINLDGLKTQLRSIPALANRTFKCSDYESLAKLAKEISFEADHCIATAGQPMEQALYIVISGEIQISDEENGCVNIFTGGDHFGSQALIDNASISTQTVEVLEPSKCMVLTRQSIESVISNMTLLGQSVRPISAKLDQTIQLDDLSKKTVLGVGSFGLVWLVQHKKTNATYALKILCKKTIAKQKLHNHTMREKNVMASVDHPFLVNLKSTFQDNSNLYMLQEFIPGGELFTVLHREDSDGVSNDDARFYAACVYGSISYLHKKHICHRDLKPENILIDKNGYCILIDLGFARVVLDKTRTMCGTPEYMAPELILAKGHDKAVDLWAFGVLVYEMIVGQTPFFYPGSTQKSMLKRAVKCAFAFPNKEEHGIDVHLDAQDLIKKLIVKNLDNRIGYSSAGHHDDEVKSHAWFDGIFDDDKLLEKKIEAPWVPKLKNETDTSNFEDYSEEESSDIMVDEDALPDEVDALFIGF